MAPPASTRSPGQRWSEEQLTTVEDRLIATAVRLDGQPWLPKSTLAVATATPLAS